MTYGQRVAMRFGMVCACGIAAASCEANELQPIRDPPSLDAAIEVSSDRDAGVRDAASAESAPPVDGTRKCKRGIAQNAGPGAVLAPSASSPGVSWWYNWAAQSPGGDPLIEFVPMIWGGASLTQSIPAGSRYLLGFNEPNFNTQANLTAQQAASDWPMVEAKANAAGIPIASPSVNFCASASDASQCNDPAVTDPYTYLKSFFAACAGCQVDTIAVHATVCDLPSLRAYLEGGADAGSSFEGFVQFGRPIWVTELACDTTHSVADQKVFMQAAVPYLESDPHVFRYAWFNAKTIPNAELTTSDGALTELGTTYVGLPQTCR